MQSSNTDFFSTMGKLSMQFAGLETAIKLTISKLMPSIDWKLTSRLLAKDSFVSLLSKLKRILLYQINDELSKKEFIEILTEIDKLRTERNNFLHSLWTIDESTNAIILFKLKSEKELILYGREHKSLNDIKELVIKTTNAIDSLRDLSTKFKTILK